MKSIFFELMEQLKTGQDIEFVTILHNNGFTPRKAGANMIVLGDSTIGTIGGGNVEYQSILLARELLKQKKSMVKEFLLSKEDRDQIGMICGGDMLVAFQYLSQQDLSRFESLINYQKQDLECWYDLNIHEDRFSYTITTKKDDHHLNCSYFNQDKEIIFTQPILQKGMVYIFGGGHISKELAMLLHRVSFKTTVVDNDEQFIKQEDFPTSTCLLCPFDKITQKIKLTPEDYVVIVTRGHEFDAKVLAEVLGYPLAYIGMIGSRQKIKATYEKLSKENHYHQEDFERVHAPIGLSIGAQTPEEIAVSIGAELISIRHDRNTLCK